MRVVWINRKAAVEGGCERALAATVELLHRDFELESILLYELGSKVDRDFTKLFSAAFPVASLEAQLARLSPDTVFIHRARTSWLETLASLSHFHRVAFVHDHDMLCLRRHKLTLRGTRPCNKTAGLSCALRCGPVQRGPVSLELRSPMALQRGHKALNKLDAVIAPSRYMLNLLEEVGIDEHRLHRLAPYTQLPNARDGRRVNPRRVLYVGALTRGKGVGQLLDALALLDSDIEIELLGDGPQREQFEAQAESLGLSPQVHFHGRVDQAEVFDRLEEAALLVLPSIAPETFALVGAEALAAEVPVVGTRAGGTIDWLCDGMTGAMVMPGDVPALARAMASTLDNPLRSLHRARRGRQRVLELINAEAQSRQLARVLKLSAVAKREVA